MPQLNVRDAAKLAGKDRSTITRAIEKGRLSASRDEAGRFLIDPAELERVFGTLLSPDVLDDDRADVEHDDARAAHEGALARELELVREMLERERLERERERRSWEDERAFMRGLIDKHTDQIKLLTDRREPTEQKRPAAVRRPRRLLARILGMR